MVNTGNERTAEKFSSKDADGKYNKRNARGVDRRSFLKTTGTGVAVTSVAGCLGGGGGLSDTVKIGVMGPADAPFGASILNSAKLAAQEINKAGGIKGHDVKVITKDTKDDPGVAQSVYQELTTGQNVDFTAGIFGSEQLLAILPSVAQQETLHLSTGAATPAASRKVAKNYDRFKYYFRVGPVNSHFLGVSLIEFAKRNFSKMGWDKIGVLIEDFKWTTPVQEVLNNRLGELEADIAVQKLVPEGTKNFTPIYDEMVNAGIDGCYTVLAHLGSTSLVTWAKQRRPFGYGGIHVATQLPSYYKATKGAARYTFSQNTATPESPITKKTVPYANAYKQQFDKYPVYDGYITYDAIYLLKKAVEKAGTTNSKDLIPVLEQVNRGGMDFTGAAGITQFYPKDHKYAHDLKYTPMTKGIYFQWQKEGGTGKQKVISPMGKESLESVPYKSPPWV